MARKQKKLVKIVWIIVSIMISITMVLFTAGAHLLSPAPENYGNPSSPQY